MDKTCNPESTVPSPFLVALSDLYTRLADEIATAGAAPQATKLAEGISTALFTTLVGLFIAIPAIAAHNILRNRVARLVLEVGIVSESLMSRFSTVDKKKSQ